MIITSVSNSRIKEIRKLHDKKEQKQTGLFFMEGLRIIGEAFDKEADVESLIVCRDLLKSGFGEKLLQRAYDKKIEIIEVNESVFRAIADKENPQGLAAVAKSHFSELSEIEFDHGIIIVLNEIADPGNLGTIIRTADAVDCQAVILLGNTVSPFEPNAVRGSMGALFSMKIIKTDFDSLLSWKKQNQIQMVGTSDHTSQDYATIKYQNPVILLMGSEREGLTEFQMKSCDAMARIPMMRSSDSLNLGVATGVMLYQIFNFHRNK